MYLCTSFIDNNSDAGLVRRALSDMEMLESILLRKIVIFSLLHFFSFISEISKTLIKDHSLKA